MPTTKTPGDPVQAVTVRPLIWEETWERRSDEDPALEVTGWEAKDPWGEYYVISTTITEFVVSHNALINDLACETEREAKSVAQADYERRILAALTVDPALAERVRGLEEAVRHLCTTFDWCSDDPADRGYSTMSEAVADARALLGDPS